MARALRVFPPGAKVLVGEAKVPATVTGISIRGIPPRVDYYEVSRYSDGDFKATNCEEFEVTLIEGVPLAVGFRK